MQTGKKASKMINCFIKYLGAIPSLWDLCARQITSSILSLTSGTSSGVVDLVKTIFMRVSMNFKRSITFLKAMKSQEKIGSALTFQRCKNVTGYPLLTSCLKPTFSQSNSGTLFNLLRNTRKNLLSISKSCIKKKLRRIFGLSSLQTYLGEEEFTLLMISLKSILKKIQPSYLDILLILCL
jgi:hypothetical protein